jgi:RNA polymerase sigma-70 factor, ECF subfamily
VRTKRAPSRHGAGQSSPPERPSFEDVYEQHIDHVWWMLRRFGVAEAHCDDAAQEVFIVVLRRLPEYEPRDRLKGWLAAIALNVAAKFRHRETLARAPETDGPESDTLDLEGEIASADEVRRVLEEVDIELRIVFILHDLEHFPAPDIGLYLEVPEGTVKSRLRVARKAVKAAWKRHKARERRTDGSNVVPIFGPPSWMDAAREVPRLPDDRRARIWAGIQRTRLGGGDGGGPRGGNPPAAPKVSGLRPLVSALRAVPARALVALAASLFGAGIAAGFVLAALWFRQAPRASLDAASAAPASAAPAAPVSTAPALPMPSSAPTTAPLEVAPPPTSAPDDAAATFANERVLMGRAEAAMAEGNPDAALDALREHARRFHGGGRLAQQRETLWIAALLRAGRKEEARIRLEGFAQAYPNSPSLPKLRKAAAAARD